MKRFLKENSLSIVMFLFFALTLGGQAFSGLGDYNQQQQEHDQPTASMGEYIGSSHFLEALFENWESEFLQMGAFVVLTVFLRQKGSPESKKIDGEEEVDREPDRKRKGAPWPVRANGLIGTIYAHSLSIALFAMFLLSFAGHAIAGAAEYSDEQEAHGEKGVTAVEYLATPTMWFQSMQNWQSEFLSIGMLIVLSIYLREKGSPESKPVDAPHDETGD
jgi:hypothetical protein